MRPRWWDGQLLRCPARRPSLLHPPGCFWVGDPAQFAPRWRPPSPGCLRSSGPPCALSDGGAPQGRCFARQLGLREQRLPLAASRPCSGDAPAGRVGGAAGGQPWLEGPRPPCAGGECDNPDQAGSSVTHARLSSLVVPPARRGHPWRHGLISLPVLPGEVRLLTRQAVMAPACLPRVRRGGEEPDMVWPRIGRLVCAMSSGAL